jgi:arylsulfatase B
LRGLRGRAFTTACSAILLSGAAFASVMEPPVAKRTAGEPGVGDPSPLNILILLADDVGVDMLASYGLGDDLPSLPTLDALASKGLSFRNVWSNPICSPTRATIMTGRHAFRTGIGGLVQGGQALLPGEITLPEVLDLGTAGQYAHAVFGKWHLANDPIAGAAAPNQVGWQHFEGTHGNLYPPHILTPPPYDYFFYEKIENGVSSEVTGYATTDQVDWFLDWVGVQTKPWVAYMAFNAPHAPWHVPPAGLYSVDLSSVPPASADPRPYYKAMLEALDFEMGRLLDGIAPLLGDTIVIFIGDNGTPSPVPVAPFDPTKAKTTIYEGGIRVPMIVAGPGVATPGGDCQALVTTTDLFATVASLAGVNLEAVLPGNLPLDSISFVHSLASPGDPSLRKTAYAERFRPNGQGPYDFWNQAMRNQRYKLIRRLELPEELYDLDQDPFELVNLLTSELTQAEARHYRVLGSAMDDLVGVPSGFGAKVWAPPAPHK